MHSTNLKNALKNICIVVDRFNDAAKTKVYTIFPAILVLVNIPIGLSGVVAPLFYILIFEYPYAPHTKERVSCDLRSNATLPPVLHLGIGQYPPSQTIQPS